MRFRSVASLVLVALIAGAIAAHADSSAAPRRARTPVRVVPAPAPARPLGAGTALAIACAAPVPVAPGRRPSLTQPPKAATAAPPSQQLLDAFAILRRPRTDQDALSPEALEALHVRGLSPVSLDSSRLLRSTPSGGKAWIVPVPNVVGLGVACTPVGRSGPREGLAVVAVGDAASGGGGALDDLVRGRAPVAVAPCAGADHSMLSISGIVPDGVPAVFLTAPDGTAVRADVKDNGYEFLLPNQRPYEQRYVVWTGGDGTPHVQPIVTFAAMPTRACKSSAKLAQTVARVSPDGLFPCGAPPIASKFAVPVPRPAPRALRLRRQVEAMFFVTRCAGLGPFAPGGVVVPGRPGPAPPIAVVPARPAPAPLAVPARPIPAPAAPAPSAVPARPVPAPTAPAPAPRRQHR
jgi:hypothetical protein